MSFDNPDTEFIYDADPFGPVDAPTSWRQGSRPHAVRWVPLVANPHVWCMDEWVENLTKACVALGRRPLFVDAAALSPQAPASAALDLGACVRPLTRDISYLPAGGLPRRYADAQGSAERLLHEIQAAVPYADTVIVHADASDLARLFRQRQAQPLLLAVDESESLKEAYTGWKWLNLRCRWTAARLLIAQTPAERGEHMARSLAQCAAQFMEASLLGWAVLDAAVPDRVAVDPAIVALLADQLGLPSPVGRRARSPQGARLHRKATADHRAAS